MSIKSIEKKMQTNIRYPKQVEIQNNNLDRYIFNNKQLMIHNENKNKCDELI